MHNEKRERLSNRLGFLLVSAGCAIGLGNIWRFPYITGKYGGAAFVLIYLICLAVVGLPILIMEFSIGRAGQRDIAGSYKVLEKQGSKWHLIGYVQPINAEELEANEGKGYTTTSLIGKAGLELAYEDTLRGIDGTDIYIVDGNENRVATIATQDKKDGTDVKLTIDSNLQKQVYDQMKDDKGFFVIMEPKTRRIISISKYSYI